MLISYDIGVGSVQQVLSSDGTQLPFWSLPLGTGSVVDGPFVSGFTVSPGIDFANYVMTNSGTALATGTIILPAITGSPAEFIFRVVTDFDVTTLTVQLHVGVTESFASITNLPTSLQAGSGFSYYYNGTTNLWYRLT
jgi:hypothetical protein